MMVMRRPKKASSLRSPRGVERWGGTERGTPVPHQHQGCLGECVPPPVPSRWHLPYLSRKRKKRVSMMVMRTPPQRGMLRDGKGGIGRVPLGREGPWGRLRGTRGAAHRPAESRLKAMAVPITSCMSEPMMAISIMSQSSTRGTWRGRGTVRCLSPQGSWPQASWHNLQGGDACPCSQAVAGHPEQHGDARRPVPASPTTQSQGARRILNPSLPLPPHPCPSGS